MSIGHSQGYAPHMPDMRKNQEDVTKEDLDEAKRKIEGSLNHSEGHGVSLGAKMA